MSLTTHRSETTAYMHFRLGEIARFQQWAEKNGLEVSIKAAGAANPAKDLIIMGYEEGIATWAIHRAAGSLWLCHMGNRTEQGLEGSNGAVVSAENALARIIVDIEGSRHDARKTDSRHRTNTGHARGR